jgi:DNA-binding winged helix-turn-helix (wHTH) protein
MTAAPSPLCYRFGRFELQADKRRLLAAGAPVDVGARAFDLLAVLVERDGHLVTKDELLERVWPNAVVEENTLQAQVSALRKILGTDAIATISGRGYRFALELTFAGAESVAPRHNLPQQLTSFIGREKEIAEIKELLGTTRLLTFIGAGGCGKTRLAIQVAGDLLESYSEGIWLVEFAALAEPGLVPETVANILRLKEQPGRSLTQTISEHLAFRHLLLLLDNAEHLLAACGEVGSNFRTDSKTKLGLLVHPGETVPAPLFDDAIYRRADSDPAYPTPDIVGSHRLEKHRWQMHLVAVEGNVGNQVRSPPSMLRAEMQLRDRRRLAIQVNSSSKVTECGWEMSVCSSRSWCPGTTVHRNAIRFAKLGP